MEQGPEARALCGVSLPLPNKALRFQVLKNRYPQGSCSLSLRFSIQTTRFSTPSSFLPLEGLLAFYELSYAFKGLCIVLHQHFAVIHSSRMRQAPRVPQCGCGFLKTVLWGHTRFSLTFPTSSKIPRFLVKINFQSPCPPGPLPWSAPWASSDRSPQIGGGEQSPGQR